MNGRVCYSDLSEAFNIPGIAEEVIHMKKILAFFYLIVLLLPVTLFAQPRLYHATKEDSHLYILGGTEVPDNNWFDTRIQQALKESSTLWVEIPPADPAN